nr:FecR domain-containing protein [Sphingomonas tagetis]
MDRTRDDIIAEASHWVAENQSGEMTAERREALEIWLHEHPDHAKAFRDMETLMASVAGLRSLGDLEPRPMAPLAAPRNRRSAIAYIGGSRPGRIALSAIAASLAVMLLLPILLPRAETDISTTVAEIRLLKLADGTRVTLGPKSRIRTSVAGSERYAELIYGEAFFEVAHDRSRPFLVNAGDTSVRVLGTRFDVNRGVDRVSTTVLDGVVQVREEAPLFGSGPRHVLGAFQQVETKADVALFDARSASGVVKVDVPPGEWREGRLTYANARLADVVDDLNRYYAPGVRIEDPKLADARIATTFMRDDLEAFFANLPLILPVKIGRDSTGEVTISAKK